jgi:hypothetical protein
MRAVSTASTTEESPAAPPRLHRRILVSNLVAGAACQLVLVALGLWPLAVIGAGYVAVGSVVLAAAYAREPLTRRQEIGSWVGTWLLAVALWLGIIYALDGAESAGTVGTWLGLLFFVFAIGTVCFLVWQLGALAVRQLIVARARSRRDP